MHLSYNISKPAKLENMESLIAYAQNIWTEMGMDSALADKLHLVLEEILVNIVKYAYPDSDSKGDISLSCGMQDQKSFCMQIKDHGQAFNPLDLEDPDTNEDLEKRPIGGLGIYLVKQISDFMEYKRENQTNIITICFNKQST